MREVRDETETTQEAESAVSQRVDLAADLGGVLRAVAGPARMGGPKVRMAYPSEIVDFLLWQAQGAILGVSDFGLGYSYLFGIR